MATANIPTLSQNEALNILAKQNIPHELGVTELVGINEKVDQNDWSGSVGVSLGGTYSGEITQLTLIATEDGSGAIQDSAGILVMFDADPVIASGDTSITAAAAAMVVGAWSVPAANWNVSTTVALQTISDKPIKFHELATLYFAWFHSDAQGLNDAAGDDEQLEMNLWAKFDT